MAASPNAILLAELQDAKEDNRMLQLANDDCAPTPLLHFPDVPVCSGSAHKSTRDSRDSQTS